ncbi:hypothetical protein [Bdellovibrio sp. HCB337]|uniref:hypothetical protein n=1 Tax=Bdellovibrio sp. HCB337 TaxID=3394358 RepID=UPI0039A638D5
MISELWSAFPQMIVQKINGLLDDAEPNPARAFQIYKACQAENLWNETFEKFSQHLQGYFSLSRHERRKSHFDRALSRPMSMEIYEKFHLTFRSALVNNRTLLDIASWAHHLVRVGYKTTCPVASEDVFTKTLQYITNPPHFEKDENIDLDDFCSAWTKTVNKLFGKTYDDEFNKLLKEIHSLNLQIKEAEVKVHDGQFFPTIYLTQTEIDWTIAVRTAAVDYKPIPKFPLSRGPKKQRLCTLYSTIGLYALVLTAKDAVLLKHRETLRDKILEQCDSLLRDKAA